MNTTYTLEGRELTKEAMMIRYALKCGEAHRFDGWFGSSDDFDRQRTAAQIGCVVCGSTAIEKDLMAPRVGAIPGEGTVTGGVGALRAAASPAEQALRDLRAKIEATSENVGRAFAAEARRIHEGDAPVRAIIGEARPTEARALIEDGIRIAPLPWSARKAN